MSLLPAQLRIGNRVPVFDPEDCTLCLVSLSQLDLAKYSILDVPKFHPRFDIHGSNELNAENVYAVVTRAEHASAAKSYIARLHFYRLGWWRAGVMRMVGRRYRRLWIGPLPACARLDQRS